MIRNLHVSHVKKTAPAIKVALPNLLGDYMKGASILQLARKSNYPPYLVARYIVEAITNLAGGKKGLSGVMRDPLAHLTVDVILPEYRRSGDTSLAQEVKDATDADPMYGPYHDKERHMVGIEFEVVLEYKLKAMSKCQTLRRKSMLEPIIS